MKFLKIKKKRKFKLSSIPGDIPPKLKREFYVELATPVANIFNSITTAGEYPRQWVREFVTPIPKVENVESLDDLRNISLTADLSKDYETFIVKWLEPYIRPKLDPGQFGSLKRHSPVHYLILLLNFIISNCDKNDQIPRAVIIALCAGSCNLLHLTQ